MTEVLSDRPRLTAVDRGTVAGGGVARWLLRLRGQGAVILLVVLLALGLPLVDGFAASDNLVRIVQSQAIIGIAAIGMTWIVLSGSFVDLSIPAVLALAANAILLLLPDNVLLAFAVALGVPLLVGAVNGTLVGRFGVNPIIVTLGVSTITLGSLQLATGGETTTGSVEAFRDFGQARPLGIPISALFFIGLLIAAQVVLTRTRFGAATRFVGASPDAARASGIRSSRVILTCFVLSAGFAAAAGILYASFSNLAETQSGAGYEFDALAAVVIGGTALAGGIGSFWRTLVGVMVIGVANNLMLLLGFDSTAQLFAKGMVFIAVVVIDALARRGETP